MKPLNEKPLLVFILLLGTAVAWPSPAQRGRIVSGTITSSALKTNLYGDPATRSYRVYLPPSYDTSAKRYPVVYALHGWYGDELQILNGSSTDYGVVKGLKTQLDTMIWDGTVGEMIVVFPNANNKLFGSFYLSSPVIGDYETYVVKELVTLIDKSFRTLTNRQSRGITGYSMGGWGAMHLAFKYPEVFSVAVPQAGRYDSRCSQSDAQERQLASFHPTNFTQFMNMGGTDVYLCVQQAVFAGLLPNPERKSLYTDYVYEWVDGKAVFNETADQRCRQGDVQNGDLPRYVSQAIRLNGIKIVHGKGDNGSVIANARGFTNALHAAGIEFEYQEHSGRHDYLPELALPFLSRLLLGSEYYVASPRMALTLATNEFRLVFSTQTNVQYTVESASALPNPSPNWTQKIRIDGDGTTATITMPAQPTIEFFRVKAERKP